MRYIYKCIRCEKDIEEVQGDFNETLHIEGAICRDCCRTSVNNLFNERTMIGMKKLHWTQTAEGKKRMSAIRKKQWNTMRASGREETSIGTSPLDKLKTFKRKPQGKRPKVDENYAEERTSIRSLLEVMFDRAEEMQEAARQIADRLGLEL